MADRGDATAHSARSLPEIRVPAAWTFAGLVAGLIIGPLAKGTILAGPLLAVAQPVGNLWLDALKMTILPLVAGLLFMGIVQTVATARAGPMARRTLRLFLLILAVSAATGVAATLLLLKLAPVPASAAIAFSSGAVTAQEPAAIAGIGDFLNGLIPENIVAAASDGAMLPVVVFIALFALASTRLADGPRIQITRLFEALTGAMLIIIGWVLAIAPFGVFALAAGLSARSGAGAMGALAHYILVVSAVGLVILILAYVLGIASGRDGPGRFSRALVPAQAVAISTQSSLASLPAMIASCRILGLRDESGEFVLPLAVAVFRATSPAMNLAVVIYCAALLGIDVPLAALLAGAGVAVLLSLGTVSLPGTVSFIATIAPIAATMGVPVEPLVILVAVEMLPDVMRTLANVTMNVAVVAAVDRGNDAAAIPDQK